MQADQGWTTTTGERSIKDARHGILAGPDKCLPKCSGWSTKGARQAREQSDGGTPQWRKPTQQELTLNPHMLHGVDIPATPYSLMSNGSEIPRTPPAQDQEAPAASSSAPSSSLPTLPRASNGALRQSGHYPGSPWEYKPNYKDGGPSRPRPSFASDKTFKHKRPTSPSNEKYEQHFSKQKRLKGAQISESAFSV